MRDWVFKVENLTKIYGLGCPDCLESDTNRCLSCNSTIAVRSISFTLYKGEILGIVGESGSGKTTLIRSLYFDVSPTVGQSYLDCNNRNLFEFNSQEKRKLRNFMMGMVHQNPVLDLNFEITAGGNVAEKLLMAGWKRYFDIRKRLMELFEEVELPLEKVDVLPSTLSGGMQRRVQIAKALANNPDILFLDEPTAGLDLSVQARVLDLIKRIQREFRMSMILVSHDLEVIRLLAERVLVMKEGKVIEWGLTDQILEDPQHSYTQLLVNSML